MTNTKAMITATVTATAPDGARWGWPGERVIRYEGADGTWAWVPGDQNEGDTFEIEAIDELQPAAYLSAVRREHTQQAIARGVDVDGCPSCGGDRVGDPTDCRAVCGCPSTPATEQLLALAARAALLADGSTGVAAQHAFVCHGDGSACADGCDVAADPARVAVLEAEADILATQADQLCAGEGAVSEAFIRALEVRS